MADDVLIREVKIAAPAATVFTYFSEPEKLCRWAATDAQIDFRVGGTYRQVVDGHHIAVGTYEVIDPPRSLVYTWGWEGDGTVPPGSSRIEVTFDEDGGYTVVRLRHSGLPTADSIAAHGQGWDHYLERLVLAAAGEDPGPDVWVS